LAKKQLEAFNRHKAARAPTRRAPEPKQHDRRATDLVKAVVPADAIVPCPSGDGTVLRVVRNIRHDPIAAMVKRKQLERYQSDAADMWQRDWQGAQLGHIKAMDPMKEPVDGSPPRSDPINDRQRKCLNKIRDVDARLGVQGGLLVRLVLGDCLSIAQVSQRYGEDTKIQRDRLGWLLRQCLDEIAKSYGLADNRLAKVEASG